ncbi:MAG: nuclear transport factor 2 family protein [Candidatus Binatia bacterium]|nr:nuclear transport factor 2 family protein [Candidatus Binatia bacterium]
MSFPREEIAAAANRFANANVKAEEERNWAPLADFYTDDAVYSYVGLTSGGAVAAHGKAEIRKIVMGRDMEDYAGWTFPFQWIAIDGARVITRWSNRAPERRDDGSVIECPGMSVLEYAGDGKFKSQFDLYDRLSVKAVIDEAIATRGGGAAPVAEKKKNKKSKNKKNKNKKKSGKGKKN